jgi:hypothetical protein
VNASAEQNRGLMDKNRIKRDCRVKRPYTGAVMVIDYSKRSVPSSLSSISMRRPKFEAIGGERSAPFQAQPPTQSPVRRQSHMRPVRGSPALPQVEELDERTRVRPIMEMKTGIACTQRRRGGVRAGAEMQLRPGGFDDGAWA